MSCFPVLVFPFRSRLFLSGVQFPVSKADANLESISEFGPIKDKFSVRVRKNNDSEYIGRCF